MHLDEREFRSFDGTRISYIVAGNPKGPDVVFANGLGGTFVAWRLIAEPLAEHFRIVCWDYRGTYKSETPRDHRYLDVDSHLHDMRLLFEKERIREAIIFGWSMGVQVITAFAGENPDLVRAMIPVNGAYGYVFETAFGRGGKVVLPVLNSAFIRLGPVLNRSLRLALDQPRLFDAIKLTGLVSKSGRADIFEEVAKGFKGLDMAVYFKIMEQLSRHTAEPYLSGIKAPTLVIAGECDVMTPVDVAERMVREMKDAELFVVPTGTHYTPLEFPELINLRVEKFLRDRRLMPA
ncbi:MAG: alpha/beta hydrolase [Myxococcales bacterium]|nr:alpha/beta hydrolase [Myxococcales bacterium]